MWPSGVVLWMDLRCAPGDLAAGATGSVRVFVVANFGMKSEEAADLGFIVCGRAVGIGIFGGHAKDVLGGDGNLRQQRFLHHPIIAFRIGGRNMTLVAEK